MKIVADTTIPYLKGKAEAFAEVVYLESRCFTPEAIRDADALIVRSIDPCTRELLEGSRVRLITTATIGFDHIDTRYCDEAGIRWMNAPGCNAVSVSQYILASLATVSLLRKEPLAGKTLGIVGVGHVGKEVEKRAKALGLRILRNDPPRAQQEGPAGFVSLETLASEADIVTWHTPLTKEGAFPTYHLANEKFFRLLEKRPWFINSCRGAVMDTSALLTACQEGRISESILDCWENEPNIDRQLLQRATLATPHIAGFSADGKANATRTCLQHIARFFGIPEERIDPVAPAEPVHPWIDLNAFADHRIERAILATFDPAPVDRELRKSPERFESFRNHYPHSREFRAYTIRNASSTEEEILQALGFRIA